MLLLRKSYGAVPRRSQRAQAGRLPMHYVYVLESLSEPGRHYSGETADLRRRYHQHNRGASKHTAKYRPWKLIWYAGFESTAAAMRFERYLKTGSGRAFQKRLLGEK